MGHFELPNWIGTAHVSHMYISRYVQEMSTFVVHINFVPRCPVVLSHHLHMYL